MIKKLRGELGLGPDQRFKKQSDFQRLFDQGVFVKGRFINIWLLTSEKLKKPALGLMVGRKTDLRATGRNLWKRRIREVFRTHRPVMKESVAVLVQSKKQMKAPSCADLWADMENLLRQAGGLK